MISWHNSCSLTFKLSYIVSLIDLGTICLDSLQWLNHLTVPASGPPDGRLKVIMRARCSSKTRSQSSENSPPLWKRLHTHMWAPIFDIHLGNIMNLVYCPGCPRASAISALTGTYT
jgi:hypothetical protein